MMHLLNDNAALIDHIIETLYDRSRCKDFYSQDTFDVLTASGVLLLLGQRQNQDSGKREPCLILNKRSIKVKQPGDLCCPGGSVVPWLDGLLAKLFVLPTFALGRWPYWSPWKTERRFEARLLTLLWATSLRESLEEMRLNPFRVTFLGPLPSYSLTMFERRIYPLVAWTPRQKRFYPNWEVEKIVYVPLKELLKPSNYACYRLQLNLQQHSRPSDMPRDFPCFRLKTDKKSELLWGATYHITTVFLEYVFKFSPPAIDDLPVVEATLDETYLTGQP